MGPRDHPGCAVQAGHTAQGRPQDLVSRRGEEVRGPVADTCRKKTQWVSQVQDAGLPLSTDDLWARENTGQPGACVVGGDAMFFPKSHGGQGPAYGWLSTQNMSST